MDCKAEDWKLEKLPKLLLERVFMAPFMETYLTTALLVLLLSIEKC